MSKRKIDVESSINEIYDKNDEKQSRFKEKHSLDSDEEDEKGQDYEILPEDDIEGQYHILELLNIDKTETLNQKQKQAKNMQQL